jgi:6-phosphofructokinase 1
MSKRNAFYAQSGGVTAVINASACGVIETARRHRNVIGKVYAGRNGIVGALREELIDTSKESTRAIAALRSTPSACLVVSAQVQSFDKDPRSISVDRSQGARHRLLLLQRRRRFADTRTMQFSVRLISDRASAWSKRSTTIAVHRYVRFRLGCKVRCRIDWRAAFDVPACETSTKVFVMEVMDATGWIAALWIAQETPDGARIIVFPELRSTAMFIRKVDETVRRAGYCVVVAGRCAPCRRPSSEAGTKDAFGHT